MIPHVDVEGSEPGSSSLDTKSTSARQPRRSYANDTPAYKRYKRMYHRVRSGLHRRGATRLLTLTSSPDSGDFQKDFRKLIMRLKRRSLVSEYIRCPEYTESGLRHDHILFRGSYIEQAYLSHLWAGIHGSPVVDIRKAWGSHRMASYLASYLAKAPAGRYSYSWAWVWKGFAWSWRVLKKASRDLNWDYHTLLKKWKLSVIFNIKPEEWIAELGYPDLIPMKPVSSRQIASELRASLAKNQEKRRDLWQGQLWERSQRLPS
ncbi:hypothetical protein ES703_107893 [subsurface metagenome]